MSQMLKSSGAMAVATMASRVLGLVREILFARFMGISVVAGAFHFAYMIPGLFRRLLGEGALTAAFIPIFKEAEKTEGEEAMWRTANAVISALIVMASAITGMVLLGVSLALALFDFGAETRLMLELLRVMFPYMLLVCLAAVFMGMLNARGYFFIPAIGAGLLNVVMIAAVLFLAPVLGETLDRQVFGLAIGVLLAGVAQALFQLPSLKKEGFRFRWEKPWPNEIVQRVGRRMVAGVIGVAALQINVLLTMGIAYAVDARFVAAFNYAVRLMELPQGVFGVSLATYILPALSGLAAEKKYAEFRATISQGLGYLIFLNFWAMVLLVALAEPMVRLLFERGLFDQRATQGVAFALACLAPGLVAYSMLNVLARGFYALGDTKTPMQISCFCLAVNVVLTLWLIHPFAQGGLGLANSLSACLNVGLLIYAFRRKMPRLDLSAFWRQFFVTGGTALVAGAAAWTAYGLWDRQFGHAGFLERLGAVFAPMLLSGVVYWGILLVLKLPPAWDFLVLFRGHLPFKRQVEIKTESPTDRI